MLDRWLHEQGYRYTGPTSVWDLSMLHVDWLWASEALRRLRRFGLDERSVKHAMDAEGPGMREVRQFMQAES